MKLWNLLFIGCLLSIHLCGHEVFNSPARVWLERSYLPALSGKTLYVGVGSYTTHYHSLTNNPSRFKTLEYGDEKACCGSPHGHYNADCLTFEPDELFDHVSLFGIMGHPPTVTTSRYVIIDDDTIFQAICKGDQLVKLGGTLQLGPNHKDFPGQDADFWLEQFSKAPLNKYEIIYSATYSDNIVWWGRKVKL